MFHDLDFSQHFLGFIDRAKNISYFFNSANSLSLAALRFGNNAKRAFTDNIDDFIFILNLRLVLLKDTRCVYTLCVIDNHFMTYFYINYIKF